MRADVVLRYRARSCTRRLPTTQKEEADVITCAAVKVEGWRSTAAVPLQALLSPVHDPESGHSGELPHVVRHNGELARQGDGGDLRVPLTDGRSG